MTPKPTDPEVAEPPASLRRLWAPIAGLGITQMIGWGTSFTALTVLGTEIARDLHLSRQSVFGGLSAMMLVSGVVAPRLGRRIDTHGARDLMLAGTFVGAVGLMVVAAASGALSFWFGWSIFGFAVAMLLNNAAVPALVQIAGPDSRRAVSALTIITGITSAVFLPLTEWLVRLHGWRMTMLVFSLMYIVICLPLLYVALPKAKPQPTASSASGGEPISWEGQLPPSLRTLGFWLAALWMAMQGLIAWGFNVQVIDILTGAGLGREQAIGVWMFSGPSQAAARLGDLASGGRSGVLRMAMLAAATALAGFAVALLLGVSAYSATLLAVCFGIGQGLYAVARNLLPLRLFGLKTYAATMGWLAVPLNIVSAAAPLIFSAILERGGPIAAVWTATAAGIASLVALVALDRIVQKHGGDA